ncbi:MAG: TolC family protein, partial [Pedosphaera parvula]|nr:TolC family protein [Pedosphaera parvula]
MVPEFSVEQDQSVEPLSGLPVQDTADEALGEAAQAEVGASVISLERALELAFTRNRTYQNQKEALYLEALGLTLGRHQYDPIFAAGGGVNSVSSVTEETVASDFSRHLGNARQIAQGIEMVTGTPAALLNAYADVVEQAGVVANVDATKVDLNREQDASGNVTGGVDLLLKGGGRIALALTSNFFRFLTGDPRTATASILSATFTQPLLRGAGADIAAEQLTQAERNVLYRIRDFTRFRQEFAVQVCSNYYSVLQDRDIVENAWRSYKNFEKSVERERAFAEEGRHTLADLGRIEQAQLSNETSWINAIRRYKESMDQFKILLGLSTDAHVMLDKAELEQLHQEGLQHPKIPVEDAIEVALASRLDFENTKGVTEDTVRQMKVAKNALKADVNLVLSSQVHSTGEDNFQSLDFDRAEIGGGLDIDLPIERMAERNNYRAALIAHERAIRDESLATDNVKFDVRAALRNLEQAL